MDFAAIPPGFSYTCRNLFRGQKIILDFLHAYHLGRFGHQWQKSPYKQYTECLVLPHGRAPKQGRIRVRLDCEAHNILAVPLLFPFNSRPSSHPWISAGTPFWEQKEPLQFQAPCQQPRHSPAEGSIFPGIPSATSEVHALLWSVRPSIPSAKAEVTARSRPRSHERTWISNLARGAEWAYPLTWDNSLPQNHRVLKGRIRTSGKGEREAEAEDTALSVMSPKRLIFRLIEMRTWVNLCTLSQSYATPFLLQLLCLGNRYHR